MTNVGYYAMDALLPPAAFIEWLHAYFADCTTRGRFIPPDHIRWLGVVDRLRSNPPLIEIEILTGEDWDKMYATVFPTLPSQRVLYGKKKETSGEHA